MKILTILLWCLCLSLVTSELRSTLIITTADGSVHGVDAASGTKKWSVCTNLPMIAAHHGTSDTSTISFAPNLDGDIYVTVDNSFGSVTSHQSLFTVNDLVSRAPLEDTEGNLYRGSKFISSYRVHPDLGTFYSLESSETETPSGCLWLHRTDYEVQAIDPQTGIERWKLGVSTMTAASRQECSEEPLNMLVNGDGTLAALDREETQLWSLNLGAPVMSIVSSSAECPARNIPIQFAQMLATPQLPAATPAGEGNVPARRDRLPPRKSPIKSNPIIQQELYPAKSLPNKSNSSDSQKTIEAIRPALERNLPTFITVIAVVLAVVMSVFAFQTQRRLNRVTSEISRKKTPASPKPRPDPMAMLQQLDDRSALSERLKDLYPDTKHACHSCGLRCASSHELSDHLQMHFADKQSLKRCKRSRPPYPDVESWQPTNVTIRSGVDNPGDFVRVGKILVSSVVLGYGSHGTIVYAGLLDGRGVAVKRMLVPFFEFAHAEMLLLMESDTHPHVIRYYAKEQDEQFIYLALELCEATLSDVVADLGGEPLSDLNSGAVVVMPRKLPLDVPINIPTIHRLLNELLVGIDQLHKLNIVHRDIKPQNLLLTKEGKVKISDMGLARKIDSDRSSFSTHASGTLGWAAPECLRQADPSHRPERLTKAVDIFAAGCVVYYIMTNGKHPFGKRASYERDHNVMAGKSDLSGLAHMPEAQDLVASMICHDPAQRITAEEAMNHCCWWKARRKVNFLVVLSDRVESDPKDRGLERIVEAAGVKEWTKKIDDILLLDKRRKYNDSFRDLLRFIRNKHNHYLDLEPDCQKALGPLHDGFLNYFTTRYPRMFICCYRYAREFMLHDHLLSVFWRKQEE